ncbi:MAG: right-handed parallel beta-helix repeat-containing protein, partial [Phycisphaerales bacterium]
TEPITFRGKAITVKSETGQEETTIRMSIPADANRGSVVIFEDNETATSVLDGFTITGGTGCLRTDPYPPGDRWSGHVGGGILCWEASPTIVACMITQNRADHAAGLLCMQSTAILIDCNIRGNSVEVDVGGVGCWDSSSTLLTNCIIADNTAGGEAGGVSCAYGSSVTMTNCTIVGNTAKTSAGGVGCTLGGSSVIMTDCIVRANTAVEGLGGGLSCGLDNASITMTGCTIADNKSGEWAGGGVACLHNASVSAIHCAITGNTARDGGGGMLVFDQSSATVSNCIIARNRSFAFGGGGIWCGQSSATTVRNSIIWGNTAPQGNEISVRKGSTNAASTLTISYSNVGGGKAKVNVESGCILDWGDGNIDADPRFADPNEDDFHLKSQAGGYDPNTETWVKDHATSPCIDAGDPMSSLGPEPFPNGGVVNMGAYGGTSEASKSYFGEPVCDTIVAGDMNGDCVIDVRDFCIMALHWCEGANH